MDPLLDDLNPAQREAVTHEDGPLLVVAGPGSGKTRVVSRRVAHLVRRGVGAREILAVTFTNRAARELRERVQGLVPSEGLWVGTFHSICARILRECCEIIGYPRSFTILDEEDRSRLVGRALRELGEGVERPRRGQIVHRISHAKGSGGTPESLRETAHARETLLVADAWVRYERLLREQRAMDFDDLLVRVQRLFAEHPDVLRRYASRFRHVLVDEYQDTNALQFTLARDLASGAGNLCATGDPDQSIYAWRGADLRNILDFEAHYPEARVVRLERNYRSVRRVLDAADRLIARNRDRIHKRLTTDAAAGPPVRVLRRPDVETEGEAVAEEIAARIAAGHPPSDCAVLYRVNSRSRAVEMALRRRGLPYRILRGVEFFQRAEVKDLVAWLRLLVNSRDGEALRRLVEAFAPGLGETSMDRIDAEASAAGIAPLELLRTGRIPSAVRGRSAAAARALGERIDAFLRGAAGNVEDILRALIVRVDYEAVLARRFPGDVPERMENVEELIVAGRAYDARDVEGRGIEGFVEQVALVSDQDRLEEDAPRVTLLSLHACKGLEFPAVWIVGCEEGVLPHARATGGAWGADGGARGEDRAALEEERRLLFVGMTRARERLTLTCSLRPAGWSGGSSGPSRFLDEIEGEGVVVEGLAAPPPWASSLRAPWDDGAPRRRPEAPPPRPGIPRRPFRGADPADAPFTPDFDAAPEEPVAEVRGLGFRVGDRVRHPTFGAGKVRRLEGRGSAVRVTVEFRMGLKTLDPTLARLEREGGSS